MIPAFVKQLGDTFNKSAGTTLALTTTGATTAGNLIVARVLFDNFTTASKPIVSSITKQAGETNSWVFLGAARSTSTSAGAFASGEMWCIQTTVNWSAAAYTVTLDSSVTMKAIAFAEFSGVTATQRSTAGTNYSTTTTAASATTTGTTPVTNDLALGFIFGSNVAAAQAGDNDTTAGSWSTPVGLGSTGGSGATNNFGIGQYKVLTSGSHQTLNNSATMTAGNGAIVAILQSIPDPAITQAAYRFYADGTESGSTTLAAQNAAYTADIANGDVSLQLRTLLQSTNAVNVDTTDDWRLQYEKNANGQWHNVGEILVDSYGNSSGATQQPFNATTTDYAQSFIANEGLITHASIYLSKTGTPASSTITASIYAHSGTFGTSSVPTGTALATSVPVSVSTITGTAAYIDFWWTTPTTLTSGTAYCLVLSVDTPGNSTDYVIAYSNTSTPIAVGNYAEKASGSWTATSTKDLLFFLYCDSYSIQHTARNLSGTAVSFTTSTFQSSQSFTGGGNRLAMIRGLVDKLGTPTGTTSMSIYAHSGTFGTSSLPTGTALATSTAIDGDANFRTSPAWFDFNFAGGYTPTAGTNYCAVIQRSAFTDTSNTVRHYRTSTDGTQGNFASGSSGSLTASATQDGFVEIIGYSSATSFVSSYLTSMGATTNRLTGGTGTFEAGQQCIAGQAPNHGLTGNNFTEFLFAVKLRQADLTSGDTVRFRVVRNRTQLVDGTSGMTYSQTPTINITQSSPAITQAGYRFYADGTESGSTALAAQNASVAMDADGGDVNLQLRVLLQSTSAINIASTADFQLQWEKNANGTWTNVGAPGEIHETYSESNYSATLEMAAGATQAYEVAQSVTGNNAYLKRFGFYLKKTGSPNGTFQGLLAPDIGTFGTDSRPGTTLQEASNTIASSSVSTSFTWYYYEFPGTYLLTTGDKYCLVIWSPDISTTGANNIGIGYDSTSPSHEGNMSAYTDSYSYPGDLIFDLVTISAAGASTVGVYDSSNLTDGAATTNRLTGGSGTFVAGKISEDGLVDNLGWTGNNYIELLYSITLKSADIVPGDTIRFRVLYNGATTGMTYTEVPTVLTSVPIPVNVGDTVGITDNRLLEHIYVDTVGITDYKLLDRFIVDTVNIADSIVLERIVQDTVGITDSKLLDRSISDTIGITDYKLLDRFAVDIAGLTDTFITALSIVIDVQETIGITDSFTIALLSTLNIQDIVAITDTFSVSIVSGATGRPKVYNGSTWANKPAKVYMGSGPGWVEKPVKTWTGTEWKTAT